MRSRRGPAPRTGGRRPPLPGHGGRAWRSRLKVFEAAAESSAKTIKTRVIEISVLDGDPWTHETPMRFGERHRDTVGADLEHAARINGFENVEAFAAARSGSPWFVSMVGLLAARREEAGRLARLRDAIGG